MIDLIGQRFGRLIVEEYSKKEDKHRYWLCKCDCNNYKIVKEKYLKSGDTRSCGCLRREVIKSLNPPKDFTKKRENTEHRCRLGGVYRNMVRRCNNPNDKRYKHYGGRGITICEEWLQDFYNFYDWAVNNGYEKGLELDRINVNGNYKPDNCRWITHTEQCRNMRHTKFIEYNNEKKTIVEWCEIYGINASTIDYRIKKNKTGEELFKPVHKSKKPN